jgi:hypothetical protein
MSVSGAQFGNLDNFKKTSLSGPDASRRLGSAGGAIDREARRLRRQGNKQGFMALSTEAAKARLASAGLRSFETKQATEGVEDNIQQQNIADKSERLRRGDAGNVSVETPPEGDTWNVDKDIAAFENESNGATPDAGFTGVTSTDIGTNPNEKYAGQVVGDSITYTNPFNPSQTKTKSYSDMTQAEKDRVNKTRSLTQAPPPLTRQAAFGQRGKI